MKAKDEGARGGATTGRSAKRRGRAHTAFSWRGGKDSSPHLSVERARELVRAVLPGDDDGAARAFVELLTGVAYEPSALCRDELALAAATEAFMLTGEFSRALDEFASGGDVALDG